MSLNQHNKTIIKNISTNLRVLFMYKCKITPPNIVSLSHNEVFVFGSNLAGIHGKGAARQAHKSFGAVRGVGVGHTGHSYSIPTKNYQLKPLSLDTISWYVNGLYDYAVEHPMLEFLITRIGCGLAGYKDSDIAPLFKDFTQLGNVSLPREWLDLMPQYDNCI